MFFKKNCKHGVLCWCPWPEFILVLTSAFLFLAKLGYLSGSFEAFVLKYWPMGLLIYAVMLMASTKGK